MKFCLDIDCLEYMKDLTAFQKYYIYINYVNKDFKNKEIEMILDPVSFNSPIFYDTFINPTENTEELRILVEAIKKSSVDIVNKCILKDDYFMICHYLLLQIIRKNLKMKRCENCGKFFLLRDGYNSSYCSRIPNNESKSCREIGALRKYSIKVKNDPIMKAYNQAYKTHHARKRNKKMSQAEFNNWALEAIEMKNKALARKITIEELTSWLKI
jgi:hypothetical protein